MKTLHLSAILVLFHFPLFAQLRTTGGCGFDCNIEDITPVNSSGKLYNGEEYSITAHITTTGCNGGWGQIKVYIGDSLMATKDNVAADVSVVIPLKIMNMPPKGYPVKVAYKDYECGTFQGSGYITVARAETRPYDTTAPALLRQHTNTPEQELSIFPIPTSEAIQIRGIKLSDADYRLSLTDMNGREVSLKNAHRNGDLIVIPVDNIANGSYTLKLHIASGIQTKKVRICR